MEPLFFTTNELAFDAVKGYIVKGMLITILLHTTALEVFMKQLILIGITLSIIAGCTSTAPIQRAETYTLLNDNAFVGYEKFHIETEEEIFHLDKEAINFVKKTVNPIDDPIDRMESLVRSIFGRSKFNLLYMGSANTTAMETFNNKAANCLSMSIMTYSLAKHAGFSVRFQDIQIPEYWTRREGYSLLNGHVNLKLVPKSSSSVIHLLTNGYEVDFDPQDTRKHFKKNYVGKNTIMSMFYNNKGADAILNKSYSKAYAYFRQAALVDPDFESTWVNMGILYRIHGLFESAELSYKQALYLDDENLTAWENLAFLYDFTGRHEEAASIESKVDRRRDDNPFYHFILGEQEFEEGNVQLALKHYRDALRLDKSKHEIYFGLAKAYAHLGDVTRSQRYLKKARDKSRSNQDQDKYQGKLDLLSRRDDKSI